MTKLQEFIKKRKELVWYVPDVTALNKEAIVEATLNYGDWEDFKQLVKILGLKEVARIFRSQTSPRRMRINYQPETKHYFTLYFRKHA